jgi:hypothetical protein
MSKSLQTGDAPVGLGLTAVVLGAVGGLLFFLPVLSIPLGGAGLVFGLSGLVLAVRGGWVSVCWSVVGLAVSGLALAVGLAIAQAPAGYLPVRRVPLDTQPVPSRPYVPPPARPGQGFGLLPAAGVSACATGVKALASPIAARWARVGAADGAGMIRPPLAVVG